MLAFLLAALLVALVVIPQADFALSLFGAATSIAGAFVQYGRVGGVLYLVIILLALIFFGMVRGLTDR